VCEGKKFVDEYETKDTEEEKNNNLDEE